MWSNIITLRSLSHALMWVTGLCGVVAALATGARYYVDRRASQLSSAAQTAILAAANARISAANQTAEEARQRTVELEGRSEGREISPLQEKILLQYLRPASPTPITVNYGTQDEEQRAYAESLIALFSKAGYHMQPEPSGIFASSPPAIGLQFFVRAKPPQPINAEGMQRALKAAGVESDWYDSGTPESEFDQIRMVIGSKPNH